MPYKTVHQLYAEIREIYKPRIVELENQVSNLKEKIELQEKENEVVKEEMFNELDEDRRNLKSETDSLRKQVQEKQNQLDKRELRKLASEYERQENDYRADQSSWLKYVVAGFALVVLSASFSVFVSFEFHASQNWGDKIDYYFINIALVTYLVFALRQYSAYKDLRIDYANRKTIAQSYFNILNSAEDEVIKQQYISAAADVLVSKTKINDQAHTIPEQLIESITEIAKNLSKK